MVKHQRERKRASGDAVHIRVNDADRSQIKAIAEKERRPFVDTLRCIIKLGMANYGLTGSLFLDVDLEEVASQKLERDFARMSEVFEMYRKKLEELKKKKGGELGNTGTNEASV